LKQFILSAWFKS